jgi:O-succinylbenzoic acid--CoA ligase
MGSETVFLTSSVGQFQHEPVIVSRDCSMTFAELDLRVGQVTARLQENGVRRGTHIALLTPNDWQSLVITLAILRAGAVACLLNVRNPAATIESQLKALNCKLLACPSIARRDAIAAFDSNTGALFPSDDSAVQLLETDTLVDCGNEPLNFCGQAWDPNGPATILFTSGSTHEPKAAVHSCANHVANATASNGVHALASGDRWLLSLPMYHVGGLGIMFRCLLAGAAIVLPVPGESLASALEAHGITHASLVPTQLKRLLQDHVSTRKYELLRCMLIGGAATPDAMIEQALEEGLPVCKTYGMTETSSQVATVAPGDLHDKRFTSGRALSCSTIRVATDGEVMVRGASVFLGYFDGDGIHPMSDEQGWFATGDIGQIDVDGYLNVTGRKDSRFISGGENVNPEEIEVALLALDHILQAIVTPIDDKDFGQRPVAFVDSQHGKIDDAAIRTSLEKILPRFKIPVCFHPWPERKVMGFKANREDFKRIAAQLARISQNTTTSE